MARVTRRPLAATDILDIWDHIAEDSLTQSDIVRVLHSAREIDIAFHDEPPS
jgi:plasmid stabilization system protein ParE